MVDVILVPSHAEPRCNLALGLCGWVYRRTSRSPGCMFWGGVVSTIPEQGSGLKKCPGYQCRYQVINSVGGGGGMCMLVHCTACAQVAWW